MAKGMNWGIFSLLAVVVVVLGGVAAFFVYLARRASAQPLPEPEPWLESPNPIL
jgi:heme/copper-type cytochrome/quinol oxidase subunit 2